MKTKLKRIVYAVILLVVCCAAFFYLATPTAVPVTVPEKGNLSSDFTEQGTVTPKESITITAPETGTVQTVFFQEGRQVKAGDSLLKIDTSDGMDTLEDQLKALEIQREQLKIGGETAKNQTISAREQLRRQLLELQGQYDTVYGAGGTMESQLTSAESSRDLTLREYENGKELFEAGILSQMELDALKVKLDSAEQALAAVKAAYSPEAKARMQQMLTSCKAQITALDAGSGLSDDNTAQQEKGLLLQMDRLKKDMTEKPTAAPFDGIVWELLVTEGQPVAKDQPVATLYRNGVFKLQVPMLTQDAAILKVGDDAVCRLPDGTEFPAKITFISPVARDTLSTIGLSESRCTVELEADGLPAWAGAGFQADVSFSVSLAENVLSIPTGCIVPTPDGGSAVYLLEDGKSRLVPVEKGIQSNGRTEIKSGLTGSERVIESPYDNKIKEGMRITAS